MRFEYLLRLIHQDPQFQTLTYLYGKFLSIWGEHCRIVTTENPDGTYIFSMSSDIDNKLTELEEAAYQRIEEIVHRAISLGYPKDVGELFLNISKPKPHQQLTKNIYTI